MTSVQQIMATKATMAGTLVIAPKSVTFRQHDHLVSVLFGDLLSHSYITFSTFLYLVEASFQGKLIALIYSDIKRSGV